MAYTRLHWVESETPLSADNFNNIEDGIEELQSQKVDKVSGKALSDNNYTSDEKTKLAGIEAGAEANQNAFSEILVNGSIISADAKTDHFQVIGSNGIEVSSVADSLLINGKYATASSSGVMSGADKSKLDGIEAGANNFVLEHTTVTMSLASATSFVPNSAAALTFNYLNLDAFTGIEFRDTSGNEVYGLAIVGFTITNNALRVLVRNVTSSNITLGTGTKAYAKKFS